jgi:acetyl-CoA acyltransferase
MMAEAFVCDAIRTPIGRYGGTLSGVRTDDLATVPLKALMARHEDLDWAAADDVVYGCVNQAGEDNRNVARMALLLAGLPDSVPGSTINRLCGSGMNAVAIAAWAIRSGDADFVIAGGVESMSRAPFVIPKAETAFSRSAEIHDTTIGWRFVNKLMKEKYGVEAMADTAENVADEYGISRADQDQFALRTLAAEITPVMAPAKRGESVAVDRDEHPRETSIEALAKLRPITRPNGTVTAGNASGINDGACALLIASEAAAKRHGLTPRARIVAASVAGVAPRVMGIGPLPASRKVLAKAGLTIGQMDVIELNEAFAAQALAVTRQLGLADDAGHVNPNGGAIALGHPLGASGARLVTTATYELERRKGRYALCTMCIGVGQGIAVILERI